MGLGMDMSFARRRKAAFQTDVPDLQSLLASSSARQAATRTARIQARIAADEPRVLAAPLVEIFAPNGRVPVAVSQFSDAIEPPVTSRQSK
jgi:hypothetical protein